MTVRLLRALLRRAGWLHSPSLALMGRCPCRACRRVNPGGTAWGPWA